MIVDKACFQHDMTYGDFKDLPKRTAADKVLHDKAFNIAKNPKYNGYQTGLASVVYMFFNKKIVGGAVKNKITKNKELAEELHRPIIRKFEKRKVHSSFIDNKKNNNQDPKFKVGNHVIISKFETFLQKFIF